MRAFTAFKKDSVLKGIVFAAIALFGCGGENGAAVVSPKVSIIDKVSHALTPASVRSIQGVYGAGCLDRSGCVGNSAQRLLGHMPTFPWSATTPHAVSHRNPGRHGRRTRQLRDGKFVSARFRFHCKAQPVCAWRRRCDRVLFKLPGSAGSELRSRLHHRDGLFR